MTDTTSLLVVDDDDVFRERLARAFRARGYAAEAAAGPEQAVVVAKQKRFDVAVVDLRMPTGTGLELVPLLLAVQPNMKILMLTGYGSIATAMTAAQAGAVAYLSKPADADDILRALSRAEGEVAAPPLDDQSTPSLARVEWEHINRVLADCEGNLSEAARRLGIHRRSLQRKLQKYPPRR